jgi:hypothetical protein
MQVNSEHKHIDTRTDLLNIWKLILLQFDDWDSL